MEIKVFQQSVYVQIHAFLCFLFLNIIYKNVQLR